MSQANRKQAMADTFLLKPEENDTYKGRWRIRIIQSGLSENSNYYPDEVLKNAVPLFEKARVFVKSDKEHLAGLGTDVRNIIGSLSDIAFIAGDGTDKGELLGTLTLLDPEDTLSRKLKEAWEKSMPDMFGFSIHAHAVTERGRVGNHTAQIARKFTKVKSVDLVAYPGAGGQIINLIEAGGDKPMALTKEQITEKIKATTLPAQAKSRLIEAHSDTVNLNESALKEAIENERDYVASFSDDGKVKGLGSDIEDRTSTVHITEGRPEKTANMLDAFFDPADRSVRSIRECYVDITGDKNFTGQYRNCNVRQMREAIGSSDFPSVLGDAISRRLIRDYANDTIYDVWKKLVTIVPVNDFRTQERTRFGGYGDLPEVEEGNPYNALTSPTDEKATYAIKKRGGTEELTLEMITNDDVGAVKRIPMALNRAAKRTISKFVLNFIKDNPAIYDGAALFHASHGNLGSSAFDGAAVAAGRLAMKNQQEKNSNEKIGLGPRYLWVPDDLEENAVNLFRRNTENDKTFVQSLSLEVMPVWYWTDANDWALSADPLDIPSVELGFFSGNEEPELFIQDNPSVGSMFTHDKTTYKIRHIYGGTVTDFRGLYKSVVG